MPVGAQTAIDALFNIMGFSFPPAGLDGADPRGVPILIWGGASAVGWAAIQMAKAAGFGPIYTTASLRNHDVLKRLGATECFDYHDAGVVANVRKAVAASGKPLSVVFDAVTIGLGVFEPETDVVNDTEGCTPDLAAACCYEETQMRLCAVLPVAHDSRWEFCLGVRPEGDTVIGFPQDPAFPKRMATAMRWLVANHERYWQSLPTVIVQGAEAGMAQMERVFQGKASMEKVLVKHPM